MDNDDIEKRARELQIQIWEERKNLWPEKQPKLLAMLDPEIAAKVLGIDFDKYEELGRFGDGQSRYEVAGMIDRQSRKIAVSRRFTLEIVRFTGAHEIGHWLLHDDEIMHRDRPINGLEYGKPRPRKEREADHFAACFLMPRKVVKDEFESTFGASPLCFDDNVAFRLCPSDPDSLLRPYDGSMERALVVANAEHYGGRGHFNSLAKRFGVSTKSMAIRIKELGLIQV